MKNKAWMTWILAGALVVGTCFTTFADPGKTSSDLKRYVEGVQTESVSMAMEVKDLSSQLAEQSEVVSQARIALVQSENERSQAMKAMQERIGILCANGGTDWLSEVLATGDISAALNNSSDLTEEDLQVLQIFSDAVKAEASCRMDVAEAQKEMREIVSTGEAKQNELKGQMAEDQQEIASYVKEIASSEEEEIILLEECQEYQPYICQEALETVFEKTEYVDMVKEEEAVDMVEAEPQTVSEDTMDTTETTDLYAYGYVDPYTVTGDQTEVTDLYGYGYADPYAVTEDQPESADLYGYDFADPYAVTGDQAEVTDLYGYGYADPYAVTEDQPESADLYGYDFVDPYAVTEDQAEVTDLYGYGYADPYAVTEEAAEITDPFAMTDTIPEAIETDYGYSGAYDAVEEPEEVAEEVEDDTVDTTYMNPVATTTTHSDFLGDFTITAYCGCAQCCGAAGQPTASGVMPTAGRTCAMYGIDFGTQLMINGQVYTVEDRGTPYGHVDLYFDTHEEALAFGRQTAEVYQVY